MRVAWARLPPTVIVDEPMGVDGEDQSVPVGVSEGYVPLPSQPLDVTTPRECIRIKQVGILGILGGALRGIRCDSAIRIHGCALVGQLAERGQVLDHASGSTRILRARQGKPRGGPRTSTIRTIRAAGVCRWPVQPVWFMRTGVVWGSRDSARCCLRRGRSGGCPALGEARAADQNGVLLDCELDIAQLYQRTVTYGSLGVWAVVCG